MRSSGGVAIWLGACLLVAAFLAQAVPLWLLGVNQGRAWFDEAFFHWQTVRQFLEQWPKPDLVNYRSATTPGYHLAMAWVARAVGTTDPMVLRPIGAVFTVLMLVVAYGLVVMAGRGSGERGVGSGVRRTLSGWWAGVLTLPLACSMYVVHPGVWLAPDNLGWLLVFVVVGLCCTLLTRRRWRSFGWLLVWWFAVFQATMALVQVRQSHVWVTGVVMAAAWLTAAQVRGLGVAGWLSWLWHRVMWVVFLASLPFVASVAVLIEYRGRWGGLVPPMFQGQHASSINLATPALALALIACYSIFFAAWLVPGLKQLWREHRAVLWLSAAAGLLAGVVPATTYLYEPRSSGIWNLAKLEQRLGLEVFGHSSPSIVVLSVVGAVCLAAWLTRLEPARRWLLIATFVAFEAAQMANANAWQRYQEPLLLVLIAMMAAIAWRDDGGLGWARTRLTRGLGVWRLLGPLALCWVFLGLSVQGILSAGPEARADSYTRGQQVWPADVPPPPPIKLPGR